MRRFFNLVAALIVLSLFVPVGTAGTLLAAFIFLPLPATLPEPSPGIASQISHIYDLDGNEIGIFRRFEQSKPILPTDIPEHLKGAVIASEDRNFYSHGGVDVEGTMRALWTDIRGGAISQGGSTITQQYVRNAFESVGKERSIDRKVREAILASQLDRQVDKQEILFRYLSTVYFGEGAFGVGAASETYFRKPVNDITVSEAALLAGLIPAPSRYSPRVNPDLAENKRVIVLNAMREEGLIDETLYQIALPEKVHLASAGPAPGPATVIHPPLQQTTAFPYFVDYVRRYLEERYGRERVFSGGLQIFTSIDPHMQAAAEAAVSDTLSGTEPPLEMSLVAVEPPTGLVKALVGGRDFAVEQTNLALGRSGAGSGRQPGSSFKPFVLAEAFETGITPAKRYSGQNGICVGGGDPPYCPKNYGGGSYGNIDLATAARKSVNTVFVQLIRDVGVEETMNLAREMGITSANYDPAVHGYSIALGALDVNPLDMASAFSVFANRGLRQEPSPIIRVLDNEGNVLEDNAVREPKRVLKEAVADNVNAVLRGVLESGGTAGGRGIGRPSAGKTGTTDDSADAWFVGYTPVLSTAVWMGYSDTRRPMRGIKGVGAVTGGSWPARTWQAFMSAALAGVPPTEFNEPAPLRPIADQAKLRARLGFDLGPRRYPSEANPGGPYGASLPPPSASPPPPPSTTTTSSTSTTSTTTTTTPGRPFP
jgi:penicillin-binding protein 1A